MKRLTAFAFGFSLVASAASAHVTVSPQRSDIGGVQTYELRCHNEDPAATTSLELAIPDGVTVLEVSPVEGGSFETVKTGERVTAIKFKVNVPKDKYVALKFSAKNPASQQEIHWNISQAFEDGKTVEWSDTPGAEKKGSITRIEPPLQ
jgi:uncharacterized protein YcnI